MATFTIEVDFGAGLVDISQHCEGLSKTQRLHNNLRPTVNSASFRVTDPGVAADLFAADDYLPVVIQKDSADWFVGLVRPTYSISVASDLDRVTVECVDKTILLQKKVEQGLSYTGYAVCDPGNKSLSLLHQLFYEAGFLDAELDLELINETVTTYVIDAKDGITYQQAIQELCWEFGWVYNAGNDGVITMTDLFPTSISPGALADSDVHHGFKIDKRERQYEAVRVTWHPQVTLDNRVVFEDTTGGDGVDSCKITLAAGGYYPVGSGTGDVYCEYTLDGYEILRVASARLIVNANGVEQQTFTAGFKRAKLKLYSAGGGTITKLRIRGNAICRDKNTIRRSVRFIVAASEKVLDVPAKWITASSQADRLSNGLARWYQYAAEKSYDWEGTAALTLGGAYTLTESVLSITPTIRIVEVREDERGFYRVAAEGIAAYTVGTVTRDDSVGTAPATASARALDPTYAYDDLGQTPFENWDAIPDGTELFDLRQPDCKSHVGRTPSTRQVHFEPGSILDELGNSYDNPVSKFAGLGVVGLMPVCTNLVTSPEGLTGSGWGSHGGTPTITLTDRSLSGRKFSKVSCSSTSTTYARQTLAGLAGSTPVIHAVLYKEQAAVAGQDTWLRIYDFTAGTQRSQVEIEWDIQTVTATTGTLLAARWISSTIVEVWAIATGVVVGNTNAFLCYPNIDEASGRYVHITACMVYDTSAFINPYTPTSRASSELQYDFPAPTAGAIEFWVLPQFPYDTSGNRRVWYIGTTGGVEVVLRYEAATDKWEAALIVDGSNYRRCKSTSAFTTNAGLWVWQHIKVVWNAAAQTIALYRDGVLQTDTSSAGTVTGFDPVDILQIGWDGGSSSGSIFITDLLVYTAAANTDVRHAANAVPWFDRTEVTDAEQTTRINKSGIRLHNSSLVITDSLNRQIAISNRDGLLALDAGGTVIHDIPTAPVRDGARAMGHFHEFTFDNAEYTLLNDSSPTLLAWQTGLQAVSGGNEPSQIKGVRIKFFLQGVGSSAAAEWGIRLRPTGTTWGVASTDMTPGMGNSVIGPTHTTMVGIGVLDVPVNEDLQFDYYLILVPTGTSKIARFQQLGVWI